MTSAFDPRIVRVGIQIEDNFEVFEGLDIRCTGQKFASPESSICTIKISNLTRKQKQFIMTTATPMTISKNPYRKPILVTLDVGRKSFTPFRLFQGNCWASGVTAPPDIGITLMSTTNNLAASTMQPQNLGALKDLKTISQAIADLYGLTLNFSPDVRTKNIANFNYTGGLQSAMNKLSLCGLIRVQLDGKILSIYNKNSFVAGAKKFDLNINTGMVGIPEATQSGVCTRMLIRPEPQIGGPISIKSLVNPAANGDYFIHTMNFNVTSRDDPFWYELFCDNIAYVQGDQG